MATRRLDTSLLLKMGCAMHLNQVTKRRNFASNYATEQPRGNHLVESTKKWIDDVVIGEKLCPFALPVKNSNAIRIVASAAQNAAEATHDVSNELDLLLRPNLQRKDGIGIATGLLNSAKIYEEQQFNEALHETTLIVFDGDFVRDFHEFVRLSWIVQSDAVVAGNFNNDVQLVLFHPAAKHQTYGSDEPDGNAADYTIRSPYPVIHLLRETDIMRAVSGRYPNIEELPSRNKQKLVAQGISFCKDRLRDCYIPKRS
jgi:hypothetical protein